MKSDKSLLNYSLDKDVVINAASTEIISIYKNTSRLRSKKRCMYYLHTLEPTGIEIIKKVTIKISVKEKEQLRGSIDLCIHNTDDIKRIGKIDVTTGKSVTVKEFGELFFNINSVQSSVLDVDQNFNFTIYLEFDNSENYIINPIFDIRENKISNHNILDSEIFKQKVLADENKERGMVMISSNSRVYMPKSKYIPKDFNPIETLNLYESIIEGYNKLVGFDKNNPDFLLRPREQFILISARNKTQTGSLMIDTLPQTSYLYFNDYWDVFFQFAKLFEQNWSMLEVWTNLYTIYMGTRNNDINWLWETAREDFENKNIQLLYDNYITKDEQGLINVDVKQEIYMLLTIMENLGANFITKLEQFSRENKPHLVGIEYVVYYVAKLFGINILMHVRIFGQKILDKAIINNVIDLSDRILFSVPFNTTFDKYKDISFPVIIKSIYIDDPVIVGMTNPNATINIELRGKKDFVTADYSGKFVYRISDPIKTGDTVTITSKGPHLLKNVSRTFHIVNRLDNNSINFISNNGYLIAKVMFDIVNKELIVTSTGQTFSISGEDKVYFTLILKNKQGIIKAQATITEVKDANSFKQILDGKSFEYMDNITLSYRQEGFVFISKYDGKIIYTPKEESEKFNIATCGLINYFE